MLDVLLTNISSPYGAAGKAEIKNLKQKHRISVI